MVHPHIWCISPCQIAITDGMNHPTLLADPTALRLHYFVSAPQAIALVVQAVQLHPGCPNCQQPSASLHSHYQRTLADLPWHGVTIKLQLHTRRFRCRNPHCSQKVFCERLPKVAAAYARQTVRLNAALTLLAFALGGQAGAHTACGLHIPISGDTLLRRIRRSAFTHSVTPQVLGVDDWAKRKGQSYGTILVDLEQRCPLDLLADRESETLAAWLKAHPGVQVVSRDRSPAYAAGINEGAPLAVQVADRFHLLQNLREALERVLKGEAQKLHSQTITIPSKPIAPVENAKPECLSERLRPHLERAGRGLRGTGARLRTKLPSARQASWLLLRPEKLKEEERQLVEQMCQRSPEIARAQQLVLSFSEMVKGRQVEKLSGLAQGGIQEWHR